MSSPPTKSAPASCASFTFSPLAITSTRLDLPSPCGNTTVPRTIWSDCLASTPRFSTSSTVSSNFTKCALRSNSAASSSLYGRASTIFRALSMFFPPTFALRPIPTSPVSLVRDFQTHVACRTHHRPHRRLHARRIQVRHLRLGDLFHLLAAHLSDFIAVRLRRSLHDARRALQQHRRRRSLQNKSERPVAVNRHQHRKNHAVRFLRGLGVELLAEIHDVHAVRAQRRAHGRRR